MSRMRRRTGKSGMHMIRGRHRPYGTCPSGEQLRPMYWTSRVDFLCYTCLKKSGRQPFVPRLGATNQDLEREQPARARPLRQQPQSMKPVPKQQKKHKHPQKSQVNTNSQEREHPFPPTQEVQALWDQRRTAAEHHTEQLRQKQRAREQKERAQQLAQDNRPLLERIREYRRHRFS
jgi:hypothetical protein